MIVFTTTRPGFMASLQPLLPHQLAAIGVRDVKNVPQQVYIHGELERWVGYDIPVLLNGEIDFSEANEFPCTVIHPDPDVKLPIEATLWNNFDYDDRWYITLPEDVGL